MNGIMLSPEKLRRYPLFAGLDDSMIKEIAMLSEEISLENGQWIFHYGDDAEALYLILSGKVEIRIPINEKDLCPPALTQLVAGDVFGWSALVDPYRYTMGAIVVSQSVCLAKMDSVSICALMGHNPTFGYMFMNRILKVVGRRLSDLQIRFVSLVEGGRVQTIEKGKSSRDTNSN